MSETVRDTMPNIFPVLRYRDASAAVDFLAAAFGFERRLVMPGPDGTVVHAELGLGPGTIMLGSAGAAETGGEMPSEARAVAQGPYVYVADVAVHHARARAAGAGIAQAPYDTDYGSREYAARDSEGLVWSFGTYLPGAPNEAASPAG
jgi:uncharacterized glyoxalase superfamily protein PhnB